MTLPCPICNAPAHELPRTGDATGFHCPVHGDFKVADTVFAEAKAKNYSREQWETALDKAEEKWTETPLWGGAENNLGTTEMISTHPHERFSAFVSLDPKNTRGFASMVGDTNPLHHDTDYTAATRFGRLLASGPQTTAHLLALTASHFSMRGAMLGLEFWVRFRRPIYADETISLEWLVISVKKHARLNGEIIDLRGRIRNENGETAIGAKGRVLVTPHH